MREDYQPYFLKLRSLLFKIGAVCIDENELCAIVQLQNDWVLIFECEKYYGPSWSIEIRPSIRKGGYSVWILMRAFESLVGKSYGLPTIENQIQFIKEE